MNPICASRAHLGLLMAEVTKLMSCHPTLPDDAPLSSYRTSSGVRVVRYGRALQALREVVKLSGREQKDFTLHSLRIKGASTLAAGGGVSERNIQRAGGSQMRTSFTP
ncbi:unnamed protein product [Pylaiella littoralis]